MGLWPGRARLTPGNCRRGRRCAPAGGWAGEGTRGTHFPPASAAPRPSTPLGPGPLSPFGKRGREKVSPLSTAFACQGRGSPPHAGQTGGVAARTPVLVAAGDAAEAGAEDTQPPVSGSPSPAGGGGVPEMHQTPDGLPGILRHFCWQRQGGRHEFLSPRTCLFPFYSGLSRNRSFPAWHHCYGVRCVHVSRLRVPVTRASAEAVFAHTVKRGWDHDGGP